MLREFLFRDDDILCKGDGVDKVEVVASDDETLTRHDGGWLELLEDNRLGIGEHTGRLKRLASTGLKGDVAFLRTIIVDGDANLAGYTSLDDIDAGDGHGHAGDVDLRHLVEVAAHEAERTASHHRIGTVGIEHHTLLILVGAEVVFAAGCQ